MNIREGFRIIADRAASFRREGLPKPRALFERGILTREAIDYQEAQHPKEPALEHDIDDPAIRSETGRELDQDHKERISALRAKLRAPSDKARRDFRTANTDRDRDYER